MINILLYERKVFIEFIIKPQGKIECPTRHKLLKGRYVIKILEIIITSKEPYAAFLLQMHRRKIEKEIIDYLNSFLNKINNL